MSEVYVEPYSEKSFLVSAQNPRDLDAITEDLEAMHGSRNKSLGGFIFSNKHYDDVVDDLSSRFGDDLVLIEKSKEELVVPKWKQKSEAAKAEIPVRSRASSASGRGSTPSPTVSARKPATATVRRLTTAPKKKHVIYSDAQGELEGTVVEEIDPDTIVADFDGQRLELKRVWQLVDSEVYPHTITLV